ncbi:MAG: hypothetical protein LLG14_20760 [Nocardiaceae bacterium]|nr:hypothetical protein [Nocardiaceae bacterium]
MRTELHSKRLAAVVLLMCALTLFVGYLNKARCAEGTVQADGRTLIFDEIKDKDVCYSDIQLLWLGRDINHHVFPYLSGSTTPDGAMVGGSVEYPVLSGVLMWMGAYYATTDGEFLMYSALLMAPFALLTAWLLGRLSGRAAFWWAIGPPLVLYAFHNWELPVVLTSVAAIYLVMATNFSLRTRGVLGAVTLALGFCLKIYPGAFVLPLMIYVLTGGRDGKELDRRAYRGFDIVGAAQAGFAAAATVVAVNLPFILGNYEGWAASFIFQRNRTADITTNSIWYWGYHAIYDAAATDDKAYQDLVSTLSPLLILASFALAAGWGFRRYLQNGTFNWIGVSGAMLCSFMLLHKVYSPQYALWLMPFLVLIAVPWPIVVAYIAANACVGIGIFRYFYALSHGINPLTEERIVQVGVWSQSLLLVYFFVAFLWAKSRISVAPSSTPPTGSSTPDPRTKSSLGR